VHFFHVCCGPVNPKIPLFELTHHQFCQEVQARLGKGAQHAGLLYEQILRTGAPNFSLPAFGNAQTLVQAILELTDLSIPAAAKENSDGQTGKFLLTTDDALEIESVIIPMNAGGTLCVSSQIGCRMGCTFCETGRMGLLRNLTVSEITGQVFVARHEKHADVRNVVFMGMGEPFDNYDTVMQAVRVLTDPKGFGFGKRHITVSTSGCAEGIRRLTHEKGETPNLAVSISAPTDELRNRLMPINRKHDMQELHACMQEYNQKTGRQILIAYVLLKDYNDSLEHADKLAAYLEGLDVKVNLIPYNPQSRDRYQPSAPEVLNLFTQRLRELGIYTLLRVTKGQEIMAACGQLGNMELRKLRKKTAAYGYNENRDIPASC